MVRLPQPGGDDGAWGNLLNDFLAQVHNGDGTLKTDSVGSAQLQDNAVTASNLAPNSVTSAALASDAVDATNIANGSITESLLDTGVQTKLNTVPNWNTISNKPAVIASGADQASARSAIGAQSLLSTTIVISGSSTTLLSTHAGNVLRIPSACTITLNGSTLAAGASVTLFAEGLEGFTVDATSATVLGGSPFLNVNQNGIAWVFRVDATNWIVAGGTS